MAVMLSEATKLVFSRTLKELTWKNSYLLDEFDPREVEAMKRQPGKDMLVFGSGSIVSQLTRHGLIDEYQFVVNPVLLGSGRSLLKVCRPARGWLSWRPGSSRRAMSCFATSSADPLQVRGRRRERMSAGPGGPLENRRWWGGQASIATSATPTPIAPEAAAIWRALRRSWARSWSAVIWCSRPRRPKL
jgi:hypothetical protein